MKEVGSWWPHQAQNLLDRLKEAAIRAVCTDGVVWVSDDCNMSDLLRVLREWGEEYAREYSEAICEQCGYDLCGHSGDARCPECGHTFRAPPADVTCSRCGEEVPGNFTVCWNCGSGLDA